MTLAEFEAKYPKLRVGDHKSGAKVIPDPIGQYPDNWHDLSWDMCHLSDYFVSSYTGGTYWLCKA